MKKLFFAILPLLATANVYGQFSTTGTITSTPNTVGIGTTNPLGLLDVTGTVTNAALSNTVKINAAILKDHTSYGGIYLGYDNLSQTGVIGGATAGNPSNLAFGITVDLHGSTRCD
ncbi:hypothetical protein [Mucilaginibacter polytrichastri]|uniref:hypothetical protein n=1 Tax=Mucilaginibacter polytrichastri TaxID=1302689 RepID=UPI0008E4E01B|nr:hypothetical protein [Mucilaginibacter polytrichastri]SFT18496.1 hypothetical protein SAMN04487890_11513 [Mucilaginibacter polytrichastri]